MTDRLDRANTQIAPDAFIAKGAVVLGDVHVGAEASVWFGSVLRGDVEMIRVGARSNIQDLSVVHADAGFPCLIEDEVTVGHRCILHGCRIGRRALIGMGSIIMNGAVIGEEAIIGAGALIPEGKIIPPRALVLGSPGRVKRDVTEQELAQQAFSYLHYVEKGQLYIARGYQTDA